MTTKKDKSIFPLFLKENQEFSLTVLSMVKLSLNFFDSLL